MNIDLILMMAADVAPDRLAFVSDTHCVTFRELHERAHRVAAWVKLRECRNLVFLGQNGISVPTCLFAASIAGITFVPLNYRLPDDALRKLLARTAPAIAIVDDDMLPRAAGIPDVDIISRSQFEALASNSLAAGEPPIQESLSDPDNIGVTLFTSGTTGVPKAAILRHAQLFTYATSSVELGAADESDVALVCVPPYHIAGVSAILTNTYATRRVAYLRSFTPESWIELVARAAVTQAMVVPTMLEQILSALEPGDTRLESLRALSYGGGRMPPSVIERALQRLPEVDFVNAYGLTETSSTVAVLGPDEHRQAFGSADPLLRARLHSVGKPLAAVEIEIRSPDGLPVPAGALGEVFVRGGQVSGEYEQGRATDAEGWFPTRDQGYLDAGGYLFVTGRLDDVIVRGGENISPGEVEDALRSHPDIADAAVVGLPDDRWGEKIAAVLVARGRQPEASELSEWVRNRLRSTKTPELFQFRPALPYSEAGKLLRRVLKDELSRTHDAR